MTPPTITVLITNAIATGILLGIFWIILLAVLGNGWWLLATWWFHVGNLGISILGAFYFHEITECTSKILDFFLGNGKS